MTANTLTSLIADYLDMLGQEGVADPLSQRFPLALVLADLLSLAGVAVPRTIEDQLQAPHDLLSAD